MKKAGIISFMLALLVIACSITAVIPIAAEINSPNDSWILGDADGDGEVTIFDVTIIQRLLVDFEVKDPERVRKCGDINGDGLDIIDATLIQRYLAEFTVPYPIGTHIEQPTEQETEQPTEEITDPAFIVETVNANAGDQNVAVNVAVKNNPGIAAIALDISYDKDKLALTGFSYNTDALNGASTTPYNASASIPCLYMVNGTKNVQGDFVFATLYFNVLNNAKGNCPISISYDEDNVYDISETNIAFEVVNGAIVVGEPIQQPTKPATSDKHTVVFKDHDGKVLSTQTVNDGEPAIPPTIPTREGYVFVGWDIAFDHVYDDYTIVAVYEEIGNNPCFIIDKVNAKPGDKNVAVTVAVKNNPGVAAIALDIMYDIDSLKLTNFTYNTADLNGASTTPYNANAYQPCLYMVNGTMNVEGDFTFATMYFDVLDTANGICPISVVYDEDNVYDINEDNIAFDVINGSISVTK